MAIESWVSSWYSEYVQENQQAPSYNDYVAEGGKASLQEYFDWQFNAPALNAVKTSTNVIYLVAYLYLSHQQALQQRQLRN